jgi:hypothetical protein
MSTSPSRNDLATGLVRPHNADVPVNAVKIPTAPTARVTPSTKALQTPGLLQGQYAIGT